LWVIQLDLSAAVAGHRLEPAGVAAGEDRYELLECLSINLSGIIVRQGLGKTRPLVDVALLIAVGSMHR
jgi:hypothetical protein